MPPRRSPRTALFSITFICSFLGAINDPVQTPISQVSGMLDGTVLLSIKNINTSETLHRIEWDFKPQSGTELTIAIFQGGVLERPNPNDRFRSRLELADETSLKIQNLKNEDSGLYKAWVRFHSGKVEEHLYHLEVHDDSPIRFLIVGIITVFFLIPMVTMSIIWISMKREKWFTSREKGECEDSTERKEEGYGLCEEFEECFKCPQCPREDLGKKVRPETVLDPQGDNDMYRLNCTEAGSFRCCITDLIFDVRAAVTFTYYFDSWSQHLSEEHRKQWDIAGPLLNIQADPEEAVAAVRFPHFLCLAEEDYCRLHIAHFVKGGMSLESPSSVWPYYVEMKNPTFSPHGVVSEKPWHKLKRKIHAVALLYQDLQVSFPKLHFYLLPNDSSLRTAVQEQEEKFNTQRIRKPPETKKALTSGAIFCVKNTSGFKTCPEYLKFKRRPAKEEQQYLELSADNMEKTLELSLVEMSSDEKVWEALVRIQELNCTILPPTEEVPAPGRMGHQKAVTHSDHLLDILENLTENEFKRFKRKLNKYPVRNRCKNIPKGLLEKADAQEVCDLLYGYYTKSYAVQVAAEVLENINIKDQAEKLLQFTGMAPHPPKNT